MTNQAKTEKAIKFLSKNPTLIGVVHGVDLYEHPSFGDEAPLFAITKDGRVKETEYWELPDAMEALDLLDL